MNGTYQNDDACVVPIFCISIFLMYLRNSISPIVEINASRRLKEAAAHKAEADKIRQVKGAEAEAEARYLSGLGVARQRKAIVSGLQASVSEFSNAVEGDSSGRCHEHLVVVTVHGYAQCRGSKFSHSRT